MKGKIPERNVPNVSLPQSLECPLFFQNLDIHPAEWNSERVVLIVDISEIIIHLHLVKSLLIMFKLPVSYT